MVLLITEGELDLSNKNINNGGDPNIIPLGQKKDDGFVDYRLIDGKRSDVIEGQNRIKIYRRKPTAQQITLIIQKIFQ